LQAVGRRFDPDKLHQFLQSGCGSRSIHTHTRFEKSVMHAKVVVFMPDFSGSDKLLDWLAL
jgi:hypothetical protein